jgi:Family of unknown function (DUF6152)
LIRHAFRFLLPAFATLAVLCVAPRAAAHHSFAMFDLEKSVEVEAIIKAVHWQNPHVWIDITMKPKGKPEQAWAIEAGATRTLIRQGWKRESLKPGDKVLIEFHPMRNGSKAGSLVQVTLASGEVLKLGAQGATDAAY